MVRTVMMAILLGLPLLTVAPRAIAQSGGVPAPSVQAVDPVKERHIRTLLDLTGAKSIGEQFWKQAFGSIKKAAPQVPESEWDAIDKEFSRDIASGGIIDLLVPIYDKHFSDSEVQQLIAFYESPIGRRLVAEQPLIFQDSFSAGQQHARELMLRIRERLKEKGYNLSTARNAASNERL